MRGEVREEGSFWSTVCVTRYLRCVSVWRVPTLRYRRRCAGVQRNSCNRERRQRGQHRRRQCWRGTFQLQGGEGGRGLGGRKKGGCHLPV